MIQFEDVVKQFGEIMVLDHVNVKIEGGEFVTIVGPSGAGKSTMLKALIGELNIDSGAVTVDGYDVTKFNLHELQEYRQKIGVVFQDYKLLWQNTVYENVAFALEVCGWKDGDIQERVYEVLDLVGMLDHSDKFPAQIAGGEGQRVAIARALVHHPRLLIADEPTGNLDYWNAQQVLDILGKINDLGTTVIMTTHNREIVDQINDRVVVINKGVIVSDQEEAGYDVDLVISNPRHEEMAKKRHEHRMGTQKPAENPEEHLEENEDWTEAVGDLEIHEISEN